MEVLLFLGIYFFLVVFVTSGMIGWSNKLKQLFQVTYAKNHFNLILLLAFMGIFFTAILELFPYTLFCIVTATITIAYLFSLFQKKHVLELIAWHLALSLTSIFLILVWITKNMADEEEKTANS